MGSPGGKLCEDFEIGVGALSTKKTNLPRGAGDGGQHIPARLPTVSKDSGCN